MPTATVYRFPSTEWFQALGDCMVADPDTFKTFGWIDTTVAIVLQAGGGLSADRAWLLTFGPYTLDAVREIDPFAAVAADFALSAPYATWKEMVANIAANDGADLKHTINYLHFGQVELTAADQLKADIFFRVNGSIQAFLDKAATISTDFAG